MVLEIYSCRSLVYKSPDLVFLRVVHGPQHHQRAGRREEEEDEEGESNSLDFLDTAARANTVELLVVQFKGFFLTLRDRSGQQVNVSSLISYSKP